MARPGNFFGNFKDFALAFSGISYCLITLLLKWNGYQFQLEQNELADMFIGIADGTKDETELRYWINDHIE